jgi:hypothetical protein
MARLAPLAVGALLLGCGGSGHATKAERASYIERVNAECQVLEEQFLRLSTRLLSGHAVSVPQKLREGVKFAEENNARIRAIPVPKGDKIPGEFLRWREAVYAAIKKFVNAKPKSAEFKQGIEEEALAKRKARELVQAYGFGHACSSTA